MRLTSNDAYFKFRLEQYAMQVELLLSARIVESAMSGVVELSKKHPWSRSSAPEIWTLKILFSIFLIYFQNKLRYDGWILWIIMLLEHAIRFTMMACFCCWLFDIHTYSLSLFISNFSLKFKKTLHVQMWLKQIKYCKNHYIKNYTALYCIFYMETIILLWNNTILVIRLPSIHCQLVPTWTAPIQASIKELEVIRSTTAIFSIADAMESSVLPAAWHCCWATSRLPVVLVTV